MKILIQCEYTLDQSEVEEMLIFGFEKKEEVIKFIRNNLDIGVFDNDISHMAILNVSYTKSEEVLFK